MVRLVVAVMLKIGDRMRSVALVRSAAICQTDFHVRLMSRTGLRLITFRIPRQSMDCLGPVRAWRRSELRAQAAVLSARGQWRANRGANPDLQDVRYRR